LEWNFHALGRVKLSLFCHSHGSIKGKALRDKGFRLFTLILTPQGFSSVKSRVSEYSLLRVTEERYIVMPPDWARVLQPNQTIDMGFCANKLGADYQPTRVSVN
jgi:hypothetical protein